MSILERITQYQHNLKKIPHHYWFIAGALICLLIYSLVFFIPKKLEFSYAGDSCVSQLTLLPSAQTKKSESFNLVLKDELKIGSWVYATTKTCVDPKQAPVAGKYSASVGLLGGWFATKQFSVHVPEQPVARQSDIIDKAISTVLPLKVALTAPDTTHTYELSVADKTAVCKVEQNEQQLLCPVSTLGLTPGGHYTVALLRNFKGNQATKLVEGEVKTLLPVALQQASITNTQTVYDSPKEFTFVFDRPVHTTEVKLTQKAGEVLTDIKTAQRIDDKTLVVTTNADLARKTEFTLTLQQVIADNGSSLEAPIVTSFTTSGGPTPKSVSVGQTGVPQTAQIVVTLDQPLKDDVDISKFARVTGVNGSVSKRSETQLVFSIQAGLCEAFSLVIDKGMASATNAALSDDWKFDSRTVCGTSSVIGYSVKGRPITAYYFGNGTTTILFTGGIHGSERSGQQTMQAWVDYLMTNAYKIPADKRVVVVPNLNPDGIAANSRNNANNVNLGRNYPSANWSASIDTASGVLPTGGGTEPGSEPETKAIIALTSQLRPRLEVSFHAQGRLVGANKTADSVAIGTMYANTVGYGTMYYNAEEVMGYSITGEYEDWMGEKFGIPAILIELPLASGNYLNSQLPALMKMLTI